MIGSDVFFKGHVVELPSGHLIFNQIDNSTSRWFNDILMETDVLFSKVNLIAFTDKMEQEKSMQYCEIGAKTYCFI